MTSVRAMGARRKGDPDHCLRTEALTAARPGPLLPTHHSIFPEEGRLTTHSPARPLPIRTWVRDNTQAWTLWLRKY